jgi:metal-dependent amidase/aminoacylase/carboxypeptidase family protein
MEKIKAGKARAVDSGVAREAGDRAAGVHPPLRVPAVNASARNAGTGSRMRAASRACKRRVPSAGPP